MSKVFTNKIIIQTPPSIAAFWKVQPAIASMFTSGSNELILRIPKNKYSPITQNSSVKLLKGIDSTVVDKTQTYIGFRLKVDDSREDLRLLFKELAEYTVGNNGFVANPISIFDYQYRRDRTDKQQGYRLRRGIFTNFEEQEGTLSEGTVSCGGATETLTGGYRTAGFSFKFMEVAPVGYF